MLQLNTNKKRVLEFSVNIQGVDYQDLEGVLKFTIEDVHYGFPLEIVSEKLTAEVPPLESIVKNLKDKEIVECKLEVYGEGFYMNPWTGDFQLTRPVKVEANLQGEEDIDGKVVTATLVEKTSKPRRKTKKRITEKVNREEVLDELFKKAETKKASTKNVSKKTKTRILEMNSLVDSFVKPTKKNPITKRPVSKPKKIVKKTETVIESNDPIKLMESYGLKNKKVQEHLLETVGDGAPDKVCEQLKKMLGKSTENSFDMYSKVTA